VRPITSSGSGSRPIGRGPTISHVTLTRRPVVTLMGTDSPRWSQILAETAHDFYHLPGYLDLCAASESGHAVMLLVEQGRQRMLLPLIERPIPGGGHDVSSPYGYPGPLVIGDDDGQFLEEAFLVAAETLRSAGFATAFVRCHPLLSGVPPTSVGTVVRHGETVSIDLNLPEETCWAQMRANHRRDIEHALCEGFSVSMDEAWWDYDAFKRLYRATMDRCAASPFYMFDDRYFDDLARALAGRIHLCVVRKGEAVVGAALLVETDGIVQYHLCGSDDAFASAHPAKLIIHFAATWARARGDRVLHLGGGVGASADSLLHFKAGFSPRRHPFWTLRIVLDERENERHASRLAPGLDPNAREGFFPVYRSA
jgi:hypothetical protein